MNYHVHFREEEFSQWYSRVHSLPVFSVLSPSLVSPPSCYLCNCTPQQTAHSRLKFLGALAGWPPPGVLSPPLVTPSSQQVAPWHPPRSSASLCKLGITISCTTTHLQQTIEVLFYTSILTIFKNNITISFVCITQLIVGP